MDQVSGIPVQFKPEVGIGRCWVRDDRLIELLYVYTPSMINSLIGTVLFVLTAFNINKIQKEMTGIKNGQKHSSINDNKDRYG